MSGYSFTSLHCTYKNIKPEQILAIRFINIVLTLHSALFQLYHSGRLKQFVDNLTHISVNIKRLKERLMAKLEIIIYRKKMI